MDDIAGDALLERCIILSPEDLAKFGVKLDHPPSISSQKSDSNPISAKQQIVEEPVRTTENTPDQMNSASCSKTIKDISPSKRRRLEMSLNSKKSNVLDQQRNVGNDIRKYPNSSKATNKSNKNSERTKNKTKESFKDCVTEEKFAVINVQTPVSKRRATSKKSISPLVKNQNTVSEKVDRNLEVESDESMGDLNRKLENVQDPSRSKVIIKSSDIVLQKPKRLRPKKSLSNMLNHSVDDGSLGILNTHPEKVLDNSDEFINEQDSLDAISNKPLKETSTMLENDKSRKKRRGKINKTVGSDLSFNTDSNNDNHSELPLRAENQKKRKKGIVRIISDSDTNFDSSDDNSSNDERVSRRKLSKFQADEEKIDSEILIQNDVSLLYEMGDDSVLQEEFKKTPPKRGRPKKNSLEASKPPGLRTPAPVKENETYNPVITTSKRGRKRKEVNYSLLENPNDFKIEAEGICYPSQEPANEEKNKEQDDENWDEPAEVNYTGKQYKRTGNVTKAIKQMFSVINNVSKIDSGNDPLLGKTKRKENTDLLDKDESSICMVCNETIPNPQWGKHKRKVHYNLAWRKGDSCLELSNENFVLKTLKNLIEERKFLQCNRCSEKFKNAKKFASHLEICNGVVNSSGLITCAVCNTSLEKSGWHYHNYRQHNNLAWREGDPPLDLEDQDSVLRILNALYKARKPLHCEKCGLQKKSVLGYLSHKSTCQKSGEELENMKVACDLCGKKMLPVSMDYHLKNHEAQKAKEELVTSHYFNVNVDIIGKRKAATRALHVINSIKVEEESKYYVAQCDFQDSFVSDILRKTLDQHSPINCIFVECDFSTDQVDDMVNHMNSCEKKPDQFFVCKVCLSWYREESEIHEHIRAEHDKSFKGNLDTDFQIDGEQHYSEDDGLLDEEETERRKMNSKMKQKILVTNKVKPFFLHFNKHNQYQILYQPAYRWMLEFCEINYKYNLYPYLRNDRPWQVLGCDILSNYLPKETRSCDIAAKLITVRDSPDFNELSFKKLDLLEAGALYEDDITIFCGGPISSFAWLPTPYNQNTYNQVLAVAVFNSMDIYYSVDKNYYEPCVIQFWDFGILDVHQNSVSKPSLLFGMAVPYGPIWHLEWCPSGCLDCIEEDTTYRLGLLAVAASDSCVYIYSIDNLPDADDRGFIYKGEPVLKLKLECVKSSFEGQSYYPTRISWSKADGHRYMAVGYSTGLVALYDLRNESLLLQRGDRTVTNVILPYKSFQAHLSSITALTLNHLGGGNKFLFSASFDRTSSFWDLSTGAKMTQCKRNNVSDGVWTTQWPTYLVADDECTYQDKACAHSYYRALRYLMTPDTSSFTFAMSGINTLSFSDWLNTILHGSNAGEVMGQFTNRLFCSIEHKLFQLCYPKSIFSVTKLVKKDSTTNDIAITYNEAEKKYKVAFLDYDLNHITNTPNNFDKNKLNEDKVSSCDIREYKMQCVNKIAFNPNPQACSFYAIGYQAGFVRLQWIKFVSPLLKEQRRSF